MIALREATDRDIPAIAKIHVDTWRSTYSGLVPNEMLAALSYERRERAWHQVFANASKTGGFTYLAENESSQAIGFANGGQERTGNQAFTGELNALYILKSHQQKGIGRELVRQVAQRLTQMDIHTLLAWVLAANPACNFYEALGGQKIQRKEIERGGHKLIEIAYGWTDTSPLLQPSPFAALDKGLIITD